MFTGLQLDFPRDGDVLNRHDGRQEGSTLHVPVTGTAPPGVAVTVNGLPATVAGDRFTCEVPLTRREAAIRVQVGDLSAQARVLCDLASRPRFRFSVDDNIEWLADLGAHPDRYDSLFDHWYLAFWRRMHQDYGAKIHMNLYYQTVDQRFNLSMLPTKWRDEFEAHADWLHLSFHALQDQPEQPYLHTTYDRLAHDFELVMGEIRRFAGEAVTSRETTVHFAAVPRKSCRALTDRGIEILIGEFGPEGLQIGTNYYLDRAQTLHLGGREVWRDYAEGLTFVDCKWFVNSLALAEVLPRVEERAVNPHTGERLELLIHEQYFRQELHYFQPDVQQKAEHALRWAAEHGYVGCFWSEGFLGSPL